MKKYKMIFISIIIALLVELLIFNFPAFRTILLGKNNIDANFSQSNNRIYISDLDFRVSSIYFDYSNKLTDVVSYSLTYLPEDSGRVTLRDKSIMRYDAHYINFDTHSNCKNIEVVLKTNSDVSISHIYINHPNFNISLFRIMLVFVILLFIGKIRSRAIYSVEYDKSSKSQSTVFTLILTLICVFIGIYTISMQYSPVLVFPDSIDKEDSILMQTEAFANGSISLLAKPSKELINMDNPYNYSNKVENGVDFLYDTAYYNGNYYSYFGVAPIITLILPFRIITGFYLNTYVFNLFFIFAIVFLLFDVYRKLVDKFIKKISLFNFTLGFFAILTASNILTTLRGLKYDIVVSSGIMFLLISFSLALSLSNKKYKYIKLIGIGVSLALSVLSKPTFILYYPITIFFVLMNLRNDFRKDYVKDFACILVPLCVFGLFQMIYNLVRFDSIFEFGARYQLTAFDMNYCMSFTFGKVYAGILEYIFRLPYINPLVFPFVFTNADKSLISMNEICYENRLVGLAAVPILWVLLFKRFILVNKEYKELKILTNICIITSLVSIIISTCMAGICEPYSLDFKLILAIVSIILLLKLVENKNSSKEICRLFLILCIVTILIMLPINLTTEANWLSNSYNLKNIFEFWT